MSEDKRPVKHESVRINKFIFYETAGCCSSGNCGCNSDLNMLDFHDALEKITPSGCEIERYDITQNSKKFRENPEVIKLIQKHQLKALPVITYNGKIVIFGKYPTMDELQSIMHPGIQPDNEKLYNTGGKQMKKEEIKQKVREGYAQVARNNSSCCGPQSSCCGGVSVAKEISKGVGYSEKDMASVPEGANLGLGCGNPIALASLKEGEVVLDLGSGGGFDCFLAANRVGQTGRVIGVDMTWEMIEKARENARNGGYTNVEFRLGEIENLPVPDNFVNIIISNCVINLSPDKDQVFSESFRVLKPGGRLMVSDIVLLEDLPKAVQQSVSAYIGCLAGAALKEKYLGAIKQAGFKDIKVIDETSFGSEYLTNDPTAQAMLGDENISEADLKKLGKSVRSIKVSAIKTG